MNGETKYAAGRVVATLIAAAGWLVVGLGAVVALGVVSPGVGHAGLAALAVGGAIAAGGLLLVAAGQALRALLDIADDVRRLVEREAGSEDPPR